MNVTNELEIERGLEVLKADVRSLDASVEVQRILAAVVDAIRDQRKQRQRRDGHE